MPEHRGGGQSTVPALSVSRLTKAYDGGHTAVRDFDLVIPDGTFFGLLGPNGAGKTTVIGAICNLVRPTGGQIRVFGFRNDSREARSLVGLAEQEINLDRFLNISEILIYHGGYHGMGRREVRQRATELLEIFGLTAKAKAPASSLSGGMQRRLLLARALIHRPRLLILDEPSAGIDVELRAELWEHLRGLHRSGVTILLTTHYLEEAEALCEDVALLRDGEIIDRGSSVALRHRYAADSLAEVYRYAMARHIGSSGPVNAAGTR